MFLTVFTEKMTECYLEYLTSQALMKTKQKHFLSVTRTEKALKNLNSFLDFVQILVNLCQIYKKHLSSTLTIVGKIQEIGLHKNTRLTSPIFGKYDIALPMQQRPNFSLNLGIRVNCNSSCAEFGAALEQLFLHTWKHTAITFRFQNKCDQCYSVKDWKL